MSDFKGRHFGGEIVLCRPSTENPRWYCFHPNRTRSATGICRKQTMMTEEHSRGVLAVDHSTIYRWVQHFAPEMERRLRWQWRWPRSRKLAHRRDLRQGPRPVGVSVPCARQGLAGPVSGAPYRRQAGYPLDCQVAQCRRHGRGRTSSGTRSISTSHRPATPRPRSDSSARR